MNIVVHTPQNWTRANVGKYCEVQLGKMLQNDPSSELDELKPYLRAINIGKEGLDFGHEFRMWIRPQETDRFRLARGDILVSEGGDAGRAAIFDADGEYYFQNAINRVRPDYRGKIESRFIYYWFKFLKTAGYVEMVCNVATIRHFTAEKVKAAPLALPPLSTQRQIARFLDEKTARIDALIERKRKLLDRLAEKRQALITQAVTKGLDPDAPMKPSGIDWLGDIPAHWRIKRFRFTAKLVSGSTPTTTIPEYWDGDIRWISPKDVKSDELTSSVDNVTEYAVSDYGLRLHEEDNAVIVIRGMILARTVPVAVARGRYTINQDMKVIRSKGEVLPEYFLLYLSSIESFLLTLVAEAGHGTKALRTDVLVDIPMLLPPISEQPVLIESLICDRQKTDATIEKIRETTRCLAEYRAALVTAAVTGQIEELV